MQNMNTCKNAVTTVSKTAENYCKQAKSNSKTNLFVGIGKPSASESNWIWIMTKFFCRIAG